MRLATLAHSLYWRIAIGFIACLALMLVVQALLFIWVASLAGPTIPGRPPERFAQAVAVDLGSALEREPAIDLAAYVAEQYGRGAVPFFVMLADGRVISHGGPFPEAFLEMARNRLRRAGGPGGRGRGAEAGPRSGRGDFRGLRTVPVLVHGDVAGLVITMPRPPFGFLLRRYAPTLAVVALSVLVLGALVAAVAIFGPARQRLRDVEEAARRLGAGDLTARAPERGRDEVAAVAAAFNAMADDLAARADALAAADRARRQLLADVSHELTTPITAMRGYLETLAMPELAVDEATRARYLHIVGEETGRLERIVGDLLDLARLEGGGGTFTLDDTPLAAIFERVQERHERSAAEIGVTIETAVEPGAEIVRADGDRLEQALQNLAANALRYAPRNTAIGLRARPEQTTVTITVTDAGPGISPEHVPHVFDRFYKAESSRVQDQAAGGSGLGLSIVKAIAERHGARVSVESRPGLTTFAISGLAVPAAP